MRIAHIGNTAGTASKLALEQSKRGHIADIFVFDDLTKTMFGGHRINYNSRLAKFNFHRKLGSYDIWHYHYPFGTLKNNLEKKKGKIKLLKHYHGSDLRRTATIDKDFCIVATPDLLKFVPNGKWLPNPIDLNHIRQFRLNSLNSGRPIRIAHYPYYEINRQHHDNYNEVLSKLLKLNHCTLTKIIGVTHVEALRMIAESDLVMGKIMPEVGWFGTFELEGMALGKPVIAHVSDELYDKHKPPIFRTRIETLERDLLNLIEDKEERVELGLKGSEYVSKYHSFDTVVNNLDEYYEKIMEW